MDGSLLCVYAVPTRQRVPPGAAPAAVPPRSHIPTAFMKYGHLDDGGVPKELHSFLWTLPCRSATVRLCRESPCVFVPRESVAGSVLVYPHHCWSEGNRSFEFGLFCACKWGWRYGTHSETGPGWPNHHVGGVLRIVCQWVWVWCLVLDFGRRVSIVLLLYNFFLYSFATVVCIGRALCLRAREPRM